MAATAALNKDQMNQVTDELGQIIPAVGDVSSPARLSTTYPITIDKIILSIQSGGNISDFKIIIEAAGVLTQDKDNLLRAALYYASNNLKPIK